MQAHAAGSTDVPLLSETIGAALDRVAAVFPDNDALVVPFQELRLTYRQLVERVDEVARGLIALGLEVGDRLGMWSPNNAEWVLIQFAAAKAGVILVNINPGVPDRGAAVRARPVGMPGAGLRAGVQVQRLRRHGRRGPPGPARARGTSSSSVRRTGTRCWPARSASPPSRWRPGRSTRRATTRSTSSTRAARPGFPKGATLSHRNMLNNGFFLARASLTDADRVCIPVPFYHCFGMVIGNLACITHAAAIVCRPPRSIRRRPWNGRRGALHEPLGVPTMFIAMQDHPASASSTCRRCAPGSWPARPARSR